MEDIIPRCVGALFAGVDRWRRVGRHFRHFDWCAGLRLQGDYLAIVTLALGEIIKNLLNSIYLGFDANGLHFSMTDATALDMDADGLILINGAQGIPGFNFIWGFWVVYAVWWCSI